MSDRTRPDGESPGDPDWGALIRAELDSWNPRRLPARFTPRRGAAGRSRGRGWRPLAVAAAVTLLGVAAGTALSTPSGLAGAWETLTGHHAGVRQGQTNAGSAGATVTRPGRVVASPSSSPGPATQASAPAPAASQPAAQPPAGPPPAPGQQQSPVPVALPTANPTSTPVQLPVPTPKPTPHCILGILCVPPKL